MQITQQHRLRSRAVLGSQTESLGSQGSLRFQTSSQGTLQDPGSGSVSDDAKYAKHHVSREWASFPFASVRFGTQASEFGLERLGLGFLRPRAMAQKEGWQGDEAATFVAELCELPQYAATANRNFSLSSLRQLKRQGFLSKGLSRAGICDWQHQKRIDAELGDLEKALPTGMEGRVLARSASAPNAVLGADAVLRKNHVRQPGPPISVQRNARLVCPSNMIMRSPPLTSTAKSMLKASTSVGCLAPDGYRSRERISPTPYMASCSMILPSKTQRNF
eukprot:s148_g7.t2